MDLVALMRLARRATGFASLSACLSAPPFTRGAIRATYCVAAGDRGYHHLLVPRHQAFRAALSGRGLNTRYGFKTKVYGLGASHSHCTEPDLDGTYVQGRGSSEPYQGPGDCALDNQGRGNAPVTKNRRRVGRALRARDPGYRRLADVRLVSTRVE